MARWFKWLALGSSLVVLALLWKSFFYYSPTLGGNVPQGQKLTKLILQSVGEVQQLWLKGDYHKEIDWEHSSCEELGQAAAAHSQEYLRCNPHFLQCYLTGQLQTLAGKPSELRVEGVNVQADSFADPIPVWSPKDRVYEVVSRFLTQGEFVTPYGIRMQLFFPEFSFSYPFVLENLCHQTFLPDQQYEYSQNLDFLKSKIPKDLYEKSAQQTQVETPRIWDSTGRNITVDKYLVTVDEYNHYLWFHGREGEMDSDRDRWSHPVTSIPFEEMHAYCRFRGKRLLTASLYDASTFYRKRDEGQEEFKLISRHELFPSAQLIKNKTEQKRDIDDSYSMEYASWMGSFQWKGHYLEAVDNPWDPFFNLNTFSLLLPEKSLWNELGHRTHWNGLVGSQKSITPINSVWGTVEVEPLPLDVSKTAVTFRCYQEWGETY